MFIIFFNFILIVCYGIPGMMLINGEIKLPSYYPRCYRDDPELNKCLLNATEIVRPFLQKGVPELNLAPISPFFVPEVTLEQGTNAVNYKASIRNLTVYGLDNYKFSKFEFDVPNLKFFGSVDMGQMFFEGDYYISGKILSVPIEGKGNMHLNVTTSNGTLTQDARLVKRKGVTYLEPVTTRIKIDVGAVQSHMDGLFDGNEELAKITNTVIQDNLRELLEEVKPAYEEVFTKIMVDVLFKSVAKVPYDELYPRQNKN